MARLRKLWEDLRSGLWFVPTLIITGAVLLALGLMEVDERTDRGFYKNWPRVFGAGAEGARSTLAAVATSTMTVAGVSFSVTIVALSLASSQYTSRVLRTFLRDRANQVVLGVLLGVFAYCLTVLQAIRGGSDDHFVPQLAVSVAVLLAFAAIGFLIFFIHHIAESIQVSHILAAIGDELADAVDELFPEGLGETDEDSVERNHAGMLAGRTWYPIPAGRTGYIQTVDSESILQLARDQNGVVRMEHGIGGFVIEGTAIASISGERSPDAGTVERLEACFVVSRYRTVEQDAGFGIRQMVDMAVKALSPGVNDSTTAVMCLNYLTAALIRLARRRIEPPYRMEDNELRVVAVGPKFEGLLDLAFDQIRQNATGNVSVISELLSALARVADVTHSPRRRTALRRQAEAVQDLTRRTVDDAGDRARLEEAGAGLLSCLLARRGGSA